MRDTTCLFCDRNNKEKNTVILENEHAYVRWDNFPVSNGHLEVVPKEHVQTFFDLTDEQAAAIFDLLKQAKAIVEEKYSPDAYNLGINDGEAAGRTVHHLHIHLIPRYVGDVKNPRGGIRHIIPGKGDY